MNEKFEFYWTSSIDGKGTKLYASSEEEKEDIVNHYFEASFYPINNVRYTKKAVPWRGVFINKFANNQIGG
jgi:hypothetical protein